jgi:hypothetical protein
MRYPKMYLAARDNYCDPSTMSNWVQNEKGFRAIIPTPEELEERKIQAKARQKRMNAAHYQNNKGYYIEKAMRRHEAAKARR